jgi:hypothetical protein
LRERRAEVAGEEAREPVPVLGEEPAVRAQPLVERVDRSLIGERPTFPGSTCVPKKTMTLRRKSVIAARPSRLRRNRAMAAP